MILFLFVNWRARVCVYVNCCWFFFECKYVYSHSKKKSFALNLFALTRYEIEKKESYFVLIFFVHNITDILFNTLEFETFCVSILCTRSLVVQQ